MKEKELKLGDETIMFCPNCKEKTLCKYNGIQEHFLDHKPFLKLFTCMKCRSTFSVLL